MLGFTGDTVDIEGYPFIIRFKTLDKNVHESAINQANIEGYPFIIRFKTNVRRKFSTICLLY